jgi:hypothetical protein
MRRILTRNLTNRIAGHPIKSISAKAETYSTPPGEVKNTELYRLEPYVSINQDGEQRLDIAAASTSGTTPTTIALAADLVRYQNALRTKMRESHSDNVPLDDYPAVKQFFNAATTEAARRIRQAGESSRSSLDMAAVELCGDWDHPVPEQAPPHVNSGPEPSLESMGFRKTAGYACGANTEYECASDYTRGRDYDGPYGHCDSPRFRDQGHLVNDGKWIQFGEPKPEIGVTSGRTGTGAHTSNGGTTTTEHPEGKKCEIC